MNIPSPNLKRGETEYKEHRFVNSTMIRFAIFLISIHIYIYYIYINTYSGVT